MRLRALLFVALATGAALWGAYRVASIASAHVEQTALLQAQDVLLRPGLEWADVATDGLRVTLTGAAPDETRRLEAAEALRSIVHPSRLSDQTTLAARAPLPPPPFALEFLRNEGDVSLIGLAPETAGRDAVQRALAAASLDGAVSDMLESVDHPPPDGWSAALDFGLMALADLPRAKISVTPGQVAVTALAADDTDRAETEASLRAAAPDGLQLVLDISAPRPVITPFVAEFTMSDGDVRLVSCTAETQADADRIAAASGLPGAECALGLGAPSPDWTEAVSMGVEALRALGGGRFALSDFDASLTAASGVPDARRHEVEAGLAARLPVAFSITYPAPDPVDRQPATELAAPPHFAAVLLRDGTIRLSGQVQDAVQQAAIGGYAAALFGHDQVEDATRVEARLPDGWPQRILAGVHALALTQEGALEITQEDVSLTGVSPTFDGAAKVRALFAAREIAPAHVDLRFDAVAAAAEAEAKIAAAARESDPVGACEEAVAEAQAAQPIAFEPGSAVLELSGVAAISAIANVMADCPAVEFEIGGHTDSQGRAESNQRLSEARAEAVRSALVRPALARLRFTIAGYGATRPIADNGSEDGRARNRRIEFTLLKSEEQAQDGTDGQD